MPQAPVQIARLQAWALRVPLDRPVRTSFGEMHDRPAVFLRIEDADGGHGWGEVFANWPAAGAEHRVNLLERDVAPLVLGWEGYEPSALFDELEPRLRIRALQCGEPGPFRQVVAGLDIALWDLFARRRGVPLRRLIDPGARDAVPAYASGIEIGAAPEAVDRARAAGFEAFKFKIGFDAARDLAGLRELDAGLGAAERLSADANQAWSPEQAERFVRSLGDIPLDWLEEPIAADAPDETWRALKRASPVPLAGGENLAGAAQFDAAIAARALGVLQPDVVKWGGITGCLRVARATLAAGLRYCPHYLGGGIGLLASAELLAAVGGDGRLEVDANDNPLREVIAPTSEHLSTGNWACGQGPGLGLTALPDAFGLYLTRTIDIGGS
ncbi:mandelate racemase/muconate lactonizing enzyme family protein [Limimaricola pyoseonensis]|uniref:L-alanine-DL-glutamate epimerase n=1 Tax=Limimaricola pyoseonensis TaxID=521013 RepID=A0A1G7A173_9RHOB|nr:mandelate racemase/muconate lactonizing enzyme family protein [Limimaricola pyoseonensis]SDE07646.1 L-alanine-DL-glutamate epimerase [Limimaricola pyoseonensis]